jgi:hypothetical protein
MNQIQLRHPAKVNAISDFSFVHKRNKENTMDLHHQFSLCWTVHGSPKAQANH